MMLRLSLNRVYDTASAASVKEKEQMSSSRERIPTNLITGFLGVGKTTAIRNLLESRSSGERWAVLVNEFGEVGIDQAAMEGREGTFIRELAGGCICCTMSLPLEVTLVELIRLANPQRLLIESTGLGHPERLLDTLRGARFAEYLDVRATVCIADPRDRLNPIVSASPVFRDQIHLADVVVVNKTDIIPGAITTEFLEWTKTLFPPKTLVATTTQGQLDPAWLDHRADPLRAPLFPEAHAEHIQEERLELMPPLAPGRPIRKENNGDDFHACGWIFDPVDVFDSDRLLELMCGGYAARRLKGVFRIAADEWILVNRSGEQVSVEPISYRRDSRLEVIAEQRPRSWADYERELLNCLLSR